MRLAARSTVFAGALAAFAIAAPLASAQLNLEPTPATGQAPPTTTTTVVRPNADEQVSQASQSVPPIPPILPAATASQRAEVHQGAAAASHASAYKPPKYGPYSTAALNGYVSSPTSGGPAVVHVATHSNSFDWGDAAIGAAAGLVISLMIVGGGVLVTQRRRPKTTRAKALA